MIKMLLNSFLMNHHSLYQSLLVFMSDTVQIDLGKSNSLTFTDFKELFPDQKNNDISQMWLPNSSSALLGSHLMLIPKLCIYT